MRITILGILLSLFSINLLSAADSHQWRGPNRDGIYQETGLLKSWPKKGPALLWHFEDIGIGFSSISVVKGKIYVSGVKGEIEFLTVLDLKGKKLWSLNYGKATPSSYEGSRTTPTVIGKYIYVISGGGDVVAIDGTKRKILWTVNGEKSFGADPGRWGTAESPLVFDNKLIYTPAGEKTTMVALDRMTGKTLWQSPTLDEGGAYVSPLLIKYKGQRQIITAITKHIIGVNPDNGEIDWKVNYLKVFDSGFFDSMMLHQINTNTPIFKDGRLFITSGYDHGGLLLDLADNLKSAKVFKLVPELDNHHGHVVLVNGYLYGSNWINNKKGNWVAVNFATGKKSYETKWGGKGSIISADGMLYIYEELRGNLGLAKANPKEFKIISSFKVKKGNNQHWCHPTISDGILYLRRGKTLMAFDIRAKK